MAALGRCTTIPRSFSYILPIQSLITGVVIYGIVFAYTIRSVLFILGVVATGLQFLLGLYCCFLGVKVGLYHRYLVPTWLIALTGVWAATIYHVTVGLDAELKLKMALGDGYALLPGRAEGDGHLIWRAVAVGGSSVNCFIDLILLAIFLLIGLRRANPVGFNPNPVTVTPAMTAPARATFAQPTIASAFYQAQQPQQSASTFAVVTPGQQQHYQRQQQPPQQVYGQAAPLGSAPSMGLLNQYHQDQTQYTASQAATHIGTSPSPSVSVDQKSHVAATVSTAVSSAHYGSPGSGAFDPQNRIEILSRVISLQNPDGHWDWSIELAGIMRLCGREMTDAMPASVTSVVCALAVDICQYVWSSQREHREHTALSAAEMLTLQRMNWDLGWAQRCTERGAAWLSTHR